MKDMVLVPIKFLLFLLAALLVGTSLQVLIDFSRLAPALQRQGMRTLSLLIVNGFFLWAIPAIGITWLFSSFSILRAGRNKRIRQIFLMLLVCGSLFSVLQFFPPLEKVRNEVSQLDFQVPEKTILSSQNAFFVLNGSTEPRNGWVLLHLAGNDARFVRTGYVTKNLDKQELLFPGGGLTIPMESVTGGRQVLFEDQGFMTPIRQWLLSGISAYQASAANQVLPSAILAATTALLLASMWLFVRLTQWPLVNSVLSFLILCGMAVLPGLITVGPVHDLLSFVPPMALPWLVPGCYGLFSLVFFACILVLPSRKDWQPGVNL